MAVISSLEIAHATMGEQLDFTAFCLLALQKAVQFAKEADRNFLELVDTRNIQKAQWNNKTHRYEVEIEVRYRRRDGYIVTTAYQLHSQNTEVVSTLTETTWGDVAIALMDLVKRMSFLFSERS